MIKTLAMGLLSGVLISSCAPSPQASEPLPSYITVLPVEAGAEVLNQCSRSTIEAPTSFWVPTSDEVSAIEQELPQYLSRSRGRQPSSPLDKYFRQYIGVVAQRQRLIYINFFRHTDRGEFWRTEPVIVCDGGDDYWGIVYDVDDKTFKTPDFNGEV